MWKTKGPTCTDTDRISRPKEVCAAGGWEQALRSFVAGEKEQLGGKMSVIVGEREQVKIRMCMVAGWDGSKGRVGADGWEDK